jgi:beta-phosphoglucomutase-like phosphatase (HAD superfamily)
MLRENIDKLEKIDGIEELLNDCIKNDVKICVGSGNSFRNLDIELGNAGLLKYFDKKIFSSELVERSKPFPDIFLLAAEKMSVTPVRTIVVEDSINGIKAAKAAGMIAIGFYGATHCSNGHKDMLLEAGADFVTDKLANITEIIKNNFL